MRLFQCTVLRLSFLALWVAAATAHAAVKLPAIISDNMVIQSGMKVSIWGTADPSEGVTVALDGNQATAIAGPDGQWKVELGPLPPGGPFEMTVTGRNTTVIHNMLVGQVWVCSGQSNMQFNVGPKNDGWETGVYHYKEEIAAAHYPMIRMFTVEHTVAGRPQKALEGKWEIASPATVANFSAVGYFFGLNLFKAMHQPIGLIHSSWGGTPAESWTRLPTLQSDPAFQSIMDGWQQEDAKFPAELTNFQTEFHHWEQASKQAETEGKPVSEPPKIPYDPRRNPWRPSGLFNAMIAPLTPYRIEGVIWYQGESNADRPTQYRKLFPDMIRDWRQAWGEGDLPFLFVQLASYQDVLPPWSYPLLREAQLMTLSLPKTAMVVTTDIGDPSSIHPRNKQEVGRRLALAARAVAYGQKVIYSGPLYSSIGVEGGKIRVRFTHLGGGLTAPGSGSSVKGFEIAGTDHKFYGAEATIEGSTVVVQSDRVARPLAVRYGWQNYPVCNLYNEAGLPASPFRTDDWME
jgi:sialate O-acetylesterase